MRLHIEHDTRYHYVDAPKHLIQLLRLTPRPDAHQRVLEWRVTSTGQQNTFTDAFGNTSHTHVVNTPQLDMHLKVQGVVDVSPLVEGILLDDSSASAVPALAYLVPTDLTEGFAVLTAFAQAALPAGLHSTSDALALANRICNHVQYQAGKTDVTSTAKEAFEMASGVCQDHAHIMIAACRSLGVPARYVSGYASDSHCRLAVGRDYLDACPIRGMRAGGQAEQLDVSVTVQVMQQ